MKRILPFLSLLLLAGLSVSRIHAQCTTAVNGLYPSASFTPTNTCASLQTITTCAYASEYSLVNLTAGNAYQFSTSVGTDVITITDDATNTPIVFGTGTQTLNCTTTGAYRFYRHLAGCGAQSTCRFAYVAFMGPNNNSCAFATAISPGTINVNMNCASADVAPTCGGVSDGPSGGVWLSYTPSCSANLTASLCGGASFNSTLRVFSGTCGGLNCVTGNDDFCSTQSEVTWSATAGVTYYILVYGASTGSATLTFTQQDLTAPVPNVVSLPAATGSCSVTVLPAPTATDNCAGTITATTADPTTYITPGNYTVTWTYNDGNGNTSTQTQDVTVSPDVISPVINCPANINATNDPGQCGAVVSFVPPVCSFNGDRYVQPDNSLLDNGFFIDNGGPYHLADDFIVPDGDCWVITEFSANLWEIVMNTSMQSVTVTFYADAGGIPGAIIGTETLTSASWTASGSLGTAFGYTIQNFDFTLTNPVTMCGAPGGTTYWIGLHENTAAGNVAWSQSTVINNNTAQTATSQTGPWTYLNDVGVPQDLVFTLTSNVVGTVSDNCPNCPTITQTAGLPSGSLFPVGTTVNTYTVTDGAGNSGSCSFNVIVTDTQAPVPDAAQTFSFMQGPVQVDIEDLQVVMDSVQVTGLPTPLATGNLSSVCLNIEHTFDGDMLIYLISPSGNTFALSLANGAGGDNYTNTCFDMSAATSINSGVAPFSGSYIPEGPGGFDVFNGEDPNGYWKIQIYDQASGDEGTLLDFALTFKYIENMPTLTSECAVTVVAPTASDNCDGSITGVSTDPLTYSAEGTYTISWTYTDSDGNVTTQDQQVVINDTTAPVPNVLVLAPVTGNCSVNLSNVPSATDNCIGNVNATTTDPVSYTSAGTYTVTWTYDDGRGNTTTQTQTVVVTDTGSPVPDVTLLPNIVGNCQVTVDNPPTATDACVGSITATTTDPLFYNLVGTFFIIWHFDDGNGNTWTQNQTVVVNPCLGIEEESGQWNVLIYPNPSAGIFTLNFAEMPSENTEIKLVNNLGQVLYSGIVQSQNQQYDFSYLASGSYHLLIQNENSRISKSIIIHQNY